MKAEWTTEKELSPLSTNQNGDAANVPVNDPLELSQLTERQRKIYETIRNVPVNVPINVPINVPNLASMLGVSEKTIKRGIAAMQTVGLIKRVGSDKAGHWEVLNKADTDNG